MAESSSSKLRTSSGMIIPVSLKCEFHMQKSRYRTSKSVSRCDDSASRENSMERFLRRSISLGGISHLFGSFVVDRLSSMVGQCQFIFLLWLYGPVAKTYHGIMLSRNSGSTQRVGIKSRTLASRAWRSEFANRALRTLSIRTSKATMPARLMSVKSSNPVINLFLQSSSSLFRCRLGVLIGCPVLVSIAWLGLMYSYLLPVRASLNPESPVEIPPEQPYTNPELFRQHVIPLVIWISSSADAACAKAMRIMLRKISEYVFIFRSPFLVRFGRLLKARL